MDEKDINEAYDIVSRVTQTLCEDYEPLAVGAVLMVMGMRLYKTMLSEADYVKIIQDVLERQDKVFPLTLRVNNRGFD